jgi:hypothetical protein
MIDARELRYGVNRWCELGIVTFEQGQRILATEGAVEREEPSPRYEAPSHTSLHQLFEDVRVFVRQHPGASVLSSDDPRTRQLGWTAFKTEGDVEHCQRFTIAITSVKNADFPEGDPLRINVARAEGRARIAARLAVPSTEQT